MVVYWPLICGKFDYKDTHHTFLKKVNKLGRIKFFIVPLYPLEQSDNMSFKKHYPDETKET